MSATPADNDLIESIKAQLEGLQKTPDGLFLYRMIDRGLKNRGGEYTGDTGRDFISFLHALLHKYAANPDGDTVTRVKVRLLQQRLLPHLNVEEDAAPAPTTFASAKPRNTRRNAGSAFVKRPPEPEEVVIEGLPEQYEEPIFESADGVTDLVSNLPAETANEARRIVATDDKQPADSMKRPEALEIAGLELDESTFDEELEKRIASEAVEKATDVVREMETNTTARNSADARAEAVKASMKPLAGEPPSSANSATTRRHGGEFEIAVNDNLSLEEPADEDVDVLPEKAAERENSISIADRVPTNVKEELARSSRDANKVKPAQTLSIDPTFNNKTSVHAPPIVQEKFSRDSRKVNKVSTSRPLSIDPTFNNPNRPAAVHDPDIVVGEEISKKTVGQPKKIVSKPASSVPERALNKNSSRDRVDKLHETFAGKLADSISRSSDYHNLLRTNLKALKLADSPDDVIDIKHLLVMGLEDLLKGNMALGKDLGATNHYLKISQLDRNLLKDELGRVRDQSLVDELTGLQNKVAFGKQIESEIGRSKRYGFSLALSIVVLDRLDIFREKNGRDAGDQVLKTFANQILAGFRGYDAVARLHDNKFGILFPNTQKEGALSALEKAQKRAADTVIQLNGKSLRLPSFTSSLTLYSPGDKPEVLMKRAYDALALADENTRDKIIIALAQT